MNIRELLSTEKEVNFVLDGEKHSLLMKPPSAEVARALRDDFYKLGEKVNAAGDGAQVAMASNFEEVIGKVVKACIPAGSAAADMSDDEMRLFILRIGGDKSAVVEYALRVCGIRLDIDDAGDTGIDPAF